MKKSTQSKTQAAKKPATKPTTKPAAKPSTKPASKPTTKPASKPTAKPTSKPAVKESINTKQKEQPKKTVEKKTEQKKKTTKEKDEGVDKRAFVSGEAPKKIEKVEIKIRTDMKCIKTVQAHDDWVEKAIIVSSGKIVTIGLDGVIKVWDITKDTKKPLNMLGGHTAGITDVIEFNKNKIVTVSKDKTIRKWNINSGKEVYCYELNNPFLSICVASDTVVACAGGDKTIRFYDLSTDKDTEELGT